MSADNVTPIHPGAPAGPPEVRDSLAAVENEVREIRQTLQCAVIALDRAEDQGFEDQDDAAPAAIRVAGRCVGRLFDLEERLDRMRRHKGDG